MNKRLQKSSGRYFQCEPLEARQLLTAWYVATNGANSNPGTLQQPFATIQAAASVAQPGDTVYIFGGTYHESVVPAHGGSSGAPITYEPYDNQSVTIDGADPVSGWTTDQGRIYQAPQSWNLGEGFNQVFVDGQMVNEARFPNSGLNVSTPTWTHASKITATVNSSGMSTATLYDSALTQPTGAWVGAICHIAAGQQWVDQAALITASGPGWITISYQQETSYQVPQNGNEFYIVGAPVALDAAGEWYRSPANGQLYLWDPASDSPAGHRIEAKARQYGFDLSGLSYIDIQHINLFACTINTDSASTNDVLNGISGKYVSHSIGITPDTQDPWGAQFHPHTTGIILNGQYNILENSTIAYSSGDGVFVGGSDNTVQNCTIHDVDYEAGDEAGISTLGSDEQISYNTICNTGRSGIVLRYTYASHFTHNLVHNVGLQMTDLGAIYTWGTDGQGTEIACNVCYNVNTGGYGAGGIYLDNYSQNYIVDHNVVWNAQYALKMNPPCTDNLILNNTLIGNEYSLASYGSEDMSGSTLMNNILVGPAVRGPGLTQSHNIFTYSLTTSHFANTSVNDYQLASNSPAINAGAVYGSYTNQYTGSAPDIGAYEYGAIPFAAGATAPAVVNSVPTPPKSTPPASTSTGKLSFAPQPYAAEWAIAKSGQGVDFTKQWAYAEYSSVNFGAGVTEWSLQVSHLPATAEELVLRIDSSTGPTVAAVTLPATPQPSSSTAKTLTAAIKGLSGVHNIYIMLISPATGGELDGFSFT